MLTVQMLLVIFAYNN